MFYSNSAKHSASIRQSSQLFFPQIFRNILPWLPTKTSPFMFLTNLNTTFSLSLSRNLYNSSSLPPLLNSLDRPFPSSYHRSESQHLPTLSVSALLTSLPPLTAAPPTAHDHPIPGLSLPYLTHTHLNEPLVYLFLKGAFQ